MPNLIDKIRSSGNSLIDRIREMPVSPEITEDTSFSESPAIPQQFDIKMIEELVRKEVEKNFLRYKIELKGDKGDEGRRGERGLSGKDGSDAEAETPYSIIKKINSLDVKPALQIDAKHIKGLSKEFGARVIHRGGINLISGETPSGTINGSNASFTLAYTPKSETEKVYLNGMRQQRNSDYTISGGVITFSLPPYSPAAILVDYEKQ
jgi:hypothetical protein